MARPPHERPSRLLGLLLGLLLAGGLAEVGARWRHAHPPLPPPGSEAAPPGMFVASEAMGVVLAPSFSYPAERFSTNRLGLRDREREGARGDGIRVALLGDSFTAGVGVDDVQHSAALLEAALDGVEVWNLGTPHYGLEQSWRRLEALWPAVQPDVVVLQIFPGNDPWDDARGPGVLRVVDQEITRRPWAPSGSPFDALRPELHRPLHAHHLPSDGALWRHSHAYRAALSAASSILGRAGADTPWGMEPFDYEAFGGVAWLYLDPPPPPVVGAWRISEAALTRIAAFVAERGAELLLVAVPARIEVDGYDLEWALEHGWEGGARPGGGSVDGRRRFDPDLPQRVLAAVAARADLPLLDLRPAFRAGAREERMHYLDDSHWTAGGHREGARAVGRFLEERGLLSVPPDFDQRLDLAVPEASFDVSFEGGFRPEGEGLGDEPDGRVGSMADPREEGKSSEILARLCEPSLLLPLLPEAPAGWSRSERTARIAPLPPPREDVLVAQASATYWDPAGRPHRLLALDGAGQPEVDQWFRVLGDRALPGPVPTGMLKTVARVGLVLPGSAPSLAASVDGSALAAVEEALAPSGIVHPTLTVGGGSRGGGPPPAARGRLLRPEELVPLLPPPPAGWQVLDTVPMYRPHRVSELPPLPPWMEERFSESRELAGRDEEPWTAQVKRWYRGPAGSFALVVQDTGHSEPLLRSRQSRLVATWGPQPGASPAGVEAADDVRLRRWSGAGLRGFRACRVEQGLCKVVVPLVDPEDPAAPLARYNAILMGPPDASDGDYERLIAAIPLAALP